MRFEITAETQEAFDEQVIEAFTGANNRWYSAEVASAVQEIKDRMVEEFALSGRYDEEGIISEAIDGRACIIYTYKAQRVLLASKNDSTYEEMSPEDTVDISQKAYYAMEADVREELETCDECSNFRADDNADELCLECRENNRNLDCHGVELGEGDSCSCGCNAGGQE